MEPQIQYTQTEDGVSIAFWVMGKGKPLVHMPTVPISSIRMEWQFADARAWYERLAQKRKLVRYDCRGSGLSDRDVDGFSLDAHMLDLEAVIRSLDLEEVTLMAVSGSGPVAICYAAGHPGQVSQLVLWHCYARGSFLSSPPFEGMSDLHERNWDLFTETHARLLFGWSANEPARWWARLVRESIAPEALSAGMSALRASDTTELLPRIKVPTLVFGHPSFAVGLSEAKEMVSRIPNARLVMQKGAAVAPWTGDPDSVLGVISDFLGEGGDWAPALAKEDVHTILFTDVEGSTSLTDRLGDAKARDVLRTHERIVRDALRAYGGSEVKTMGDGFMASFSSATKALECAIAMQRAFEEHNETAEEPIKVRVGLNAGEPIAEEEDLFGTAVIRAARIAALAQGGEILVANVVRELAEGKGFLFSDRGDTELRGFEDPVRLYEVRWREGG